MNAAVELISIEFRVMKLLQIIELMYHLESVHWIGVWERVQLVWINYSSSVLLVTASSNRVQQPIDFWCTNPVGQVEQDILAAPIIKMSAWFIVAVRRLHSCLIFRLEINLCCVNRTTAALTRHPSRQNLLVFIILYCLVVRFCLFLVVAIEYFLKHWPATDRWVRDGWSRAFAQPASVFISQLNSHRAWHACASFIWFCWAVFFFVYVDIFHYPLFLFVSIRLVLLAITVCTLAFNKNSRSSPAPRNSHTKKSSSVLFVPFFLLAIFTPTGTKSVCMIMWCFFSGQ